MKQNRRHPSLLIESKDSWDLYNKRTSRFLNTNEDGIPPSYHRRLHHHHRTPLEQKIHHKQKLERLYADPGIQDDTMHGMMIDAGSSGSRMHVYEFQPRILRGRKEASTAVEGKKLTFPGTDSRWTDRLRPGIATFASLPDDELFPAIATYLQPLMEFAETVLHRKRDSFSKYPIYLKGTAGLRTLTPVDRARVMTACRDFFRNETYSKFMFETEYARVISGEEEAIYGWAAANFVRGSLLKSSKGLGTVVNPSLTYGTLELGGASAQIAFYRSNEDIMANLFKLQIGQGKHWNVYTHSFLYYGINEAWNRAGALLSTGDSVEVPWSVHHPCLPGKSEMQFNSTIYFVDGHETFQTDSDGKAKSYQVLLENKKETGNYEQCASIANAMLNKKYNTWCEFAHQGDCSFSNVYQPELPKQSETFGEFLALSNYYHIFDFLGIPERSSLRTLQNATKHLCSMDIGQLEKFNNERLDFDEAAMMCFRSSFAFEMLHNGHGFRMDDKITAIYVVNGQKVGWALGSMLYEINTLPWQYIPKHNEFDVSHFGILGFLFFMLFFIIVGLCGLLRAMTPHRKRYGYEFVENVQMIDS